MNYYASPEEGPPHKLSVTHPDVSAPSRDLSFISREFLPRLRLIKSPNDRLSQQKMLASMRDAAHANGGDVSKKVAWSKQVLKFIERTQVRALVSKNTEEQG